MLTGYAQESPTTTPPLDPNAPGIIFESNVINYGTINYDSDGTREFRFKNTGKSPLIISNVQGSCGCVVPNYPKEPIKPGATGVIKVRYNTKRVGQFEKSLTVTSNAKTPSVVIKIKGKVLPAPPQEEKFPGNNNPGPR